jgi:predicted nucleic acid-binding protein
VSQAQLLADTSAMIRLLRRGEVLETWGQPVTAGLVTICAVTELELLYTVRSKAEQAEQVDLLRDAFGWTVMPDRSYERALEVQSALTERGTHRSASPVDLLTAAAAELNGLTLLHYDWDFVEVAKVTGQPVKWLADPGSID